MKLIIAGASGFVATEVLRQSLQNPVITSVVAITRRAVDLPPGIDASKLKVIVVQDYNAYSEDVKKEFAGAGACVWTIAITPSRSINYTFEEVKSVCQDCTLTGLKAMYDAGLSTPFRFLYMSGMATLRDRAQKPAYAPLAEYLYMRGETENQVLAFAAEHAGQVEACVAKAAWVEGVRKDSVKSIFVPDDVAAGKAKLPPGMPTVTVEELAAAVLDQVLHGFEKEPLENVDLVRLGRAALAQAQEM